MRYEIRSVWEEGEDCFKKYKKELKPFNPCIEPWVTPTQNGYRLHSTLSIELNSLDDLVKLVDRVGNSVIVNEDYSLEIYDSYRE
ncbi:hypothetical protein [Limosilactobacillus oris]|uniref:hypothetical protein n=1 Tax=Limosilactobacillus oris TaxID=1632 RepID=UPI00242D19C7|nr:hypothetical protein [Limosilactobacillus oris]